MYHKPVMLQECIKALDLKPNGIYVDVTFGGGGHSSEIVKYLQTGKLYAFDQDQDALLNTIESKNFKLIHANFRHIKKFLRVEGVKQVDGILADLGVSSHQIDSDSRGFSYRFEQELDMRMNEKAELDAKKVLATYSAEELQLMFSKYGEVRNAKTLANHIVNSRNISPITQVRDLVNIIDKIAFGNKNKYLAQVFQAIRIEVNDEMGALEDLLTQSIELLKPEGKLVVMSYHSLEDRLTKNFIKFGNPQGEAIKDKFGNIFRPLKAINKKVIEATPIETKENPRARSAKLRIAQKIN